MARKKKPEEHVNHERWLVSYADFITLLFATFTALFAISNADKEKFAALAKSLNNAFSTPIETEQTILGLPGEGIEPNTTISSAWNQIYRTSKTMRSSVPSLSAATAGYAIRGGNQKNQGTEGADPDKPNPDNPMGEELRQEELLPGLQTELNELINKSGLKDDARLRRDKRGVVLSLSEDEFFEFDESAIRPESSYKLDRIIEFLRDKNYELVIEGHSDDHRLASRWVWDDLTDLTMRRAVVMRRYMIDKHGYNSWNLTATGYGSERPLVPNTTARNKKKNRRVDIVIKTKPELDGGDVGEAADG